MRLSQNQIPKQISIFDKNSEFRWKILVDTKIAHNFSKVNIQWYRAKTKFRMKFQFLTKRCQWKTIGEIKPISISVKKLIFRLKKIEFLYKSQYPVIDYFKLRAPEKWILKLRALPSRFFLFQICPHFFRGRFIWRPQNALVFFLHRIFVSPLFSWRRIYIIFTGQWPACLCLGEP